MKKDQIRTFNFLLLGLVFFGVATRALFPSNTPFAFDQIQIDREARAIASGDFALVGPRTGPAQMFTGPLIYYVAALISFVTPVGFTPIVTALALSLATGCVFALLASKYLSKKQAVLFTTLWACSPFLTLLDRTPWNPNLSLLAGGLVFLPLLKKSQLRFYDVFLISLGVFLGYQAHFSGLLLLPLSLVSLMGVYIMQKRFNVLYFALPLLGFIASLVPTIVFDMRNDWYNWSGLKLLFSGSEGAVALGSLSDFLGQKLFIVVETMGKLLFQGNSGALILGAGVLLVLMGLWNMSRQQQLLTLGWLATVVVSFALYKKSTPEYYFLIVVPVLMYALVRVFEKVDLKYVLGVFVLFAAIYSFVQFRSDSSLTIGKTRDLAAAAHQAAQNEAVGALAIDIAPTDRAGLEYLLGREPISFAQQGALLHVIYPTLEGEYVTQKISDNTALWLEDSAPGNRQYRLKHYLLEFPLGWEVEKKLTAAQADEHYTILTQDQTAAADLLFYKTINNAALKDQLEGARIENDSGSIAGFVTTVHDGEGAYASIEKEWILLIVPGEASSELNKLNINR